MKSVNILLGTGLISLLAGCANTAVTVAPVGPNPFGREQVTANGGLEVFSSLVGRTEGNNPTWYQHSGYDIYDAHGRLLQYVGNTIGRYAQAPRRVVLPAGNYRVRAHASDYLWVDVPVTIEPGRTTKIHLDDQWQGPDTVSNQALVRLPDGDPVGWQGSLAK